MTDNDTSPRAQAFAWFVCFFTLAACGLMFWDVVTW